MSSCARVRGKVKVRVRVRVRDRDGDRVRARARVRVSHRVRLHGGEHGAHAVLLGHLVRVRVRARVGVRVKHIRPITPRSSTYGSWF